MNFTFVKEEKGVKMIDMVIEKDLLREKILKAALKLVNQFGYGSLTLSELARQAKISKQRLYYHFPTPEDVILVLAEEWSRTGKETAIEALAASQETGPMKVLAISEGMFAWMRGHWELSRLGLVLYQSSPHIKKLNTFMDGARNTGRDRMKSFLVHDPHFAKMKPKDLEDVTTGLHSYMYGYYFYLVGINDFKNIDLHERNCQKGLRKLIEGYSK
jgi:AcrR family transcriptional regulator